MSYYAFKNRRNGKLLSGTDRRRLPYRQILSDEYRRPLLLCDLEIETAMLERRINPATYKVVKVRVVEEKE